MPSTVLLDHVFKERWQQVIERVAAHPYEAQCKEYGSTALHWSCSRDAPVKVISTLLTAYPKATTIRDHNGWTPLHLAAQRSNKASYDVFKRVLRANIDAVFIRDRYGRDPLQYMYWAYEMNVKEALSMHDSQQHRQTGATSAMPVVGILARNKLLRFWRKACLLAKAAYHGTISDDTSQEGGSGQTWRVVHAMSGIRGCPENVLRLALLLHPGQLYDTDERGNLPLHVAAASPSSANDDSGMWQSSSTLGVIAKLCCTERPQTASVRNRDGRLPLFLSLETGKEWDGDGVRYIAEAFPSAMLLRDEKTGLFPFMLAAVGERASLSSTYCLLHACPELRRFFHWNEE